MSHIVTIKTEIRDATAVRAACQRLGLPAPVQRVTKLFSGEATGLALQLPDWQYPVVCDLATGQVSMMFDNIVSARPSLQSGKVRALAVSSARRSWASGWLARPPKIFKFPVLIKVFPTRPGLEPGIIGPKPIVLPITPPGKFRQLFL